MLRLITPPTTEPVALAVLKRHLRQGTPGDDLAPVISIAAGSHAVGVHEGAAVPVAGRQPIFLLNAGACSAGGSVTVQLQHRDGAEAWADVPGGAFAAVTEANDNAIYELAYTGIKSSVRAVATVAGAPCEFAVTALLYDPVAEEDELLLGYLKAAREYCEEFQERSYCEQTWELTMDGWPEGGGDIKLERGPWISVDSVQYTDYAGAVTSLAENIDYVVSLPRGILRPTYGKTWPSTTLHVIDPIVIQYTAGMARIPQRVQQAILLLAAHWHENREAVLIGSISKELEFAVKALLGFDSRGVPFA